MPRFANDSERLREVARVWVEPTPAADAPTGRAWENQITNQEYVSLLSAVCRYCGDTLGFNYLEPIDPTRPIHVKNCIAKCVECNRLKGQKTREQFRQDAERFL